MSYDAHSSTSVTHKLYKCSFFFFFLLASHDCDSQTSLRGFSPSFVETSTCLFLLNLARAVIRSPLDISLTQAGSCAGIRRTVREEVRLCRGMTQLDLRKSPNEIQQHNKPSDAVYSFTTNFYFKQVRVQKKKKTEETTSSPRRKVAVV